MGKHRPFRFVTEPTTHTSSRREAARVRPRQVTRNPNCLTRVGNQEEENVKSDGARWPKTRSVLSIGWRTCRARPLTAPRPSEGPPALPASLLHPAFKAATVTTLQLMQAFEPCTSTHTHTHSAERVSPRRKSSTISVACGRSLHTVKKRRALGHVVVVESHPLEETAGGQAVEMQATPHVFVSDSRVDTVQYQWQASSLA